MNIITVQITEDGRFYRLDDLSTEFQPFPKGIELGQASAWDYLSLAKKEKKAVDALVSDRPDILSYIPLDKVVKHWLGTFDTLGSFLHCVMDEQKVPPDLWHVIDQEKFWKFYKQDYWMIEHQGEYVWFDKSLLSLIP